MASLSLVEAKWCLLNSIVEVIEGAIDLVGNVCVWERVCTCL